MALGRRGVVREVLRCTSGQDVRQEQRPDGSKLFTLSEKTDPGTGKQQTKANKPAEGDWIARAAGAAPTEDSSLSHGHDEELAPRAGACARLTVRLVWCFMGHHIYMLAEQVQLLRPDLWVSVLGPMPRILPAERR